MSLLKSIIFGIVQGLCEFLPVSSSGHLALFKAFFGNDEMFSSIAFDVLLHFGTLIAVVIIYHKDIWDLIKGFFTLIGKLLHGNFKMSEYSVNEKFVILMIIALIPLFPAVYLDGKIEALAGYPLIIGAILLVNALILYFSDKFATGTKDIDEVTPKNALVVGLCQLVGILPGISRSGSTITGGFTQGFSRELAVKFSFILSIPAILGACVLKLPDFISNVPDTNTLWTYIAGAAVAAVVGILAIKFVTWISKKAKFKVFAYYCAAIGIFAITWTLVNYFRG